MAAPIAHAALRIGELAHVEPDLLFAAGGGVPFGAVWSHQPGVTEVTGLAQHAIALHLSGCTLVEKWREGRLLGHRSRIGSITLVPAQVPSTWVLTGHSRVAHLYVDPAQLARAAASADGALCAPALRDFFAEPDEDTATLVRLVLARARAGMIDDLAHDEVMATLVRQLLQSHALERPLPAARPRVSLTAATLRRLFDHIEARLAGELRLPELAALARLSDDHFLRAFKAAVGQTPHRYVLERRVAHAQRLLLRGALPVADVARATGFRGASHFAAAFRQQLGVSPSEWRAQRRH